MCLQKWLKADCFHQIEHIYHNDSRGREYHPLFLLLHVPYVGVSVGKWSYIKTMNVLTNCYFYGKILYFINKICVCIKNM